MRRVEDFGEHIGENELPDVAKDDAADQVREEVGRAEEADALELGGAQQRQQEGHEVHHDHVHDHEQHGEQQRPHEGRILKHGLVIFNTDHLRVENAVPVREGVENTDEHGDDDGNDECEDQGEEENKVDDGAVVQDGGDEVDPGQNHQGTQNQKHAAHRTEAGVVLGDVKIQRGEHQHKADNQERH